MSEEELQAEINSKLVQQAVTKGPIRAAKNLDDLANPVTLSVDETLFYTETDAILVVWQDSSGILQWRVLQMDCQKH